MEMRAELRPRRGWHATIVLDRDVTLLGRDRQCDVVVDAPGISRKHCILVKTDGLVWLRDLVSTNGTMVNGIKVRSGALLPGDRLRIGLASFEVFLGPDTDQLSQPATTAPNPQATRVSLLEQFDFDLLNLNEEGGASDEERWSDELESFKIASDQG